MSLRWIVVLLACLLPAGCASSTVGSSPGTGRGTGPATGAAHTVRVGDAADGHTVRVHPGDVLAVRLGSTYWSFATLRGDVLHRRTTIVRPVPMGSTVPGSGAGTVTAVFVARHRGTATISAGRTTCGEAMRCIGRQGSFRLYVVVG